MSPLLQGISFLHSGAHILHPDGYQAGPGFRGGYLISELNPFRLIAATSCRLWDIKVGICSYFSVYFCFPTIIHIEIYFYDIYPYNDNTHPRLADSLSWWAVFIPVWFGIGVSFLQGLHQKKPYSCFGVTLVTRSVKRWKYCIRIISKY